MLVIGALILLCLIRAVLGPRLTDRVVAVNMIGTMTIVEIALFALYLRESYLFDVCLIYAMISFLAVVVLTTELTKASLTIANSEITVEDNSVALFTEKVTALISADTLKLDVYGSTLEMSRGKVIWNGGSETTANATELQSQLNKCKARIDAIINALASSAVAPQDGGATYKANIAAALSGLISEDYSNMIDDKIKH